MGTLTTPFVLLPSIGSVLAGYLLRDWRLAGAAAAGLAGLSVIATMSPHPYAVLVLPLLVGAAIGSLALIPLLLFRPTSSVWTRMTLALAVTFTASFAHLFFLTGRP